MPPNQREDGDTSDRASLAYQDLSPNDILASVESIGLHCDGRLLTLNSYENRVYRVGIDGGPPVVPKFYRPGRWSDAAIREEHAYTRELAAQEIPVAAPLTDAGGETLHHHGAFRFAVYPCFGGRAPELDDHQLLRQLGRFVARIHLCGQQADFRHRPRLSIQSFGIASRDYLLGAGFIPDARSARPTRACAMRHSSASATATSGPAHRAQLRLHGDFHPGNVLVLDGVAHIVDFDDTCTGPAIQDLWMFLSGDRHEQTPQLAELLAGYTEFRDFDAAELNLIEALRTLRIMHYAAWLARRWGRPGLCDRLPVVQRPALLGRACAGAARADRADGRGAAGLGMRIIRAPCHSYASINCLARLRRAEAADQRQLRNRRRRARLPDRAQRHRQDHPVPPDHRRPRSPTAARIQYRNGLVDQHAGAGTARSPSKPRCARWSPTASPMCARWSTNTSNSRTSNSTSRASPGSTSCSTASTNSTAGASTSAST
jgi:Ser/Thr protein kinase RdoA (MazF antagonist)